MSEQPFYHLRPNKYIDRQLFVHLLSHLKQIFDIEQYSYIGFGSFLFEDFKLAHTQLDVRNMISLESDPDICKRAHFNKPYDCINILNQSSSDFITYAELTDPSIIWLDYTSSDLASHFSDFCNILNIMKPNDILKITLNANPVTLCNRKIDDPIQTRKVRLDALSSMVSHYLPADVDSSDMTHEKYPLLLLKCLEIAAQQLFPQNKYQKKYFFPLLSTIYKDGQQMVTLTGIILDNRNHESSIGSCLERCNLDLFNWDNPLLIKVPSLTAKEILCINRLFPETADTSQKIKDDFFCFFNKDLDMVQSYIHFYKQYPNFHHVTF